MKDARIKAKLPPETVFYSLRHYYISKALLAGVQAQVVAENCGTSLAMIEKHYGKFLRADRKAMLDKVALTAIG
jgi:integrase